MRAVSLALPLLLAANTAPAQQALSIPIQQAALPNGLTVITVEDHRAPVVSVQLWVHAGAKNERPGITGVSHLFEHMMFKGSKKYGPEEHARLVQSAGGVLNAFTTQDITAYYEDFSSENLELAFQLESERFQNLKITPETLKTEREVVKEERRLRTDNTPTGRALEEFLAASFKAHPYGWPVVGWMPDLDAITVDDCKQYFARMYAPNNTVLVVAGDTTHDEVMKLARKYFARWKKQPAPPPVVTMEPEQHGERRITLKHPAQAPLILGGWHVPAYTHGDMAALEVASRILSDGQSSRLYQRLVYKDQLALAAVGGLMRMEHPGVFYAFASLKPGVDPARAEGAFMEEVEKLRSTPVSDDELQKARNQVEASFVFSLKKMHTLAEHVAQGALFAGDPADINKRIPRLSAVTAADVQRAARTYFTVDNRTVVTLIPETTPPAAATDGGRP